MADMLKVIAGVFRTKTPVVTDGGVLITINYLHNEGEWKVMVGDVGAIYLLRSDTPLYTTLDFETRVIKHFDTLPEAVCELF